MDLDSYNLFFERGGFFEPASACFHVSGEKAGAFLHGQLTNHIAGLAHDQANYNLLLTQKGKVLADVYVWKHHEVYFLILEKKFQEKVIPHLQKLAPLSRVDILDESNKYDVVHVCNNPSVDFLSFSTERIGFSGHDCLVAKEKKESFVDQLKNGGLVCLDHELLEIIRVEQGIPVVGQDVTEDNLPQESRLDRALHFDKGCYLGQETIARLHFRGHVNKCLVGLKVDSANPPAIENPIIHDGKAVGRITSSVFSPRLKSPLALGYVPCSLNQEGTKFLIAPQTEAMVVSLPVKSKE